MQHILRTGFYKTGFPICTVCGRLIFWVILFSVFMDNDGKDILNCRQPVLGQGYFL